jgi:hypothetical protein
MNYNVLYYSSNRAVIDTHERRAGVRYTLWARMAEEGRKGGREKLVSITGTEEIVINPATVN